MRFEQKCVASHFFIHHSPHTIPHHSGPPSKSTPRSNRSTCMLVKRSFAFCAATSSSSMTCANRTPSSTLTTREAPLIECADRISGSINPVLSGVCSTPTNPSLRVRTLVRTYSRNRSTRNWSGKPREVLIAICPPTRRTRILRPGIPQCARRSRSQVDAATAVRRA